MLACKVLSEIYIVKHLFCNFVVSTKFVTHFDELILPVSAVLDRQFVFKIIIIVIYKVNGSTFG